MQKKKEMKKEKEEKNNKPKKRKIFIGKIEESSLEGMIEEEKIIESDVSEFRESPVSTETRAPVLERIRTQVPIREERNIPQDETQEKRINYTVSNEPKYSTITTSVEREEKKYESSFTPPVLTKRNMQVPERQNFLKPSDTLWMDRGNSAEQSIDTDSPEERAGLPFENEQKKYRRFKIR